MDSCFDLFGSRQHGVAGLNEASMNASANKQRDDDATSRVLGNKKPNVSRWRPAK